MSSGNKIVGIMTGSFHTDYSRRLAQKLYGALKEAGGFSVRLFQGLDAPRYLNLADYAGDGFDSHYYTQFEYSKYLKPDYLIVSLGTISVIPNALSADELLDRLPDVPVILLEAELDRPNCYSLTVDNRAGMTDCVEHLIVDHGCREILYVSGPRGIADADERRHAYESAMQRHGLPVTDSMIVFGDFTDHMDRKIETLLAAHPRPDAIVCANDAMAESAYRVLRRHALTPGRDVAVTGFDDNDAASYAEPPLTSVRQDLDELSAGVVRLIRQLEAGERPASSRFPAQLQVRCSCGCAGDAPAARSSVSRVNQGRSKIKRMTDRNMLTALMLRKLLKEDVSKQEFFQQLGGLLSALGIDHSEILLLPEPAIASGDAFLAVPEQLCPQMLQRGREVTVYPQDHACVTCAGTVSVYEGDAPLTVFPLFFGHTHYGVFIVSLRQEEMLFCYALSLEIGTGLRYLFLSLEQQENRAALEEKNQILDYSASHDSLTGLYNRPGLLSQVYPFLRRHGAESRFVSVMADLDHLKQINDTFGHNMGDVAIRAAADVLRESLPALSLLGRTGGDEYTAVFLLEDAQGIERFRQNLAQACDSFNKSSGLPFYVGVSVGCLAFSGEESGSLLELIKETDKLLYAAKKHRRRSVIREENEA